jgi:Nucleotide-diphospho-sugar transferase
MARLRCCPSCTAHHNIWDVQRCAPTSLSLRLQGYAVLSVDLDIVLFKNPLDPAFNPLMNRELDAWVAVDNGKMLNCGFYFLRPTEQVQCRLTGGKVCRRLARRLHWTSTTQQAA